MSGAQQGYYTDGQQYGTFQAPPFMQQPQIPSPGGMYYPSVPAFPRVADGIPLSGNYNYYPGGRLEHSNREGCCHHGDPNNLPFCGLGYGWFLFLLGFFFIGVPWYVGAFIFCCLTHDYRERSGLAACAIAAIMLFLVGGGIHIKYFL
ncbi:unnamed protein product [Sphagnum compactum]